MGLDAPHYVSGNYSVSNRDRIFAKADKYPDASGGLTNQVPTLSADGTIIWRQQSSGGGDGTANANIAIVEPTSTASQAYAVGALLVYSGQLYRVTAPIAQGDVITPGTNVTPTTVANEMESSVAGVTSFNNRTGAVTPQSGDYTAAMVGARASDWTPSASDVGALPTPSNTGTVGQVLKKTASGSEWADESGGGGGSGVSSFNGRTGAVVPQSGDYTAAMVGAQADLGFVEDTTYAGCLYRLLTDNVREWLNPPLAYNTEYRTTERFMGKPVYVKVVDFGAGPAANTALSRAHGISNISSIVRHDAVDITYNQTLPYFWSNGTLITRAADVGMAAYSTFDATGIMLQFTIYYTKTNDYFFKED